MPDFSTRNCHADGYADLFLANTIIAIPLFNHLFFWQALVKRMILPGVTTYPTMQDTIGQRW